MVSKKLKLNGNKPAALKSEAVIGDQVQGDDDGEKIENEFKHITTDSDFKVFEKSVVIEEE